MARYTFNRFTSHCATASLAAALSSLAGSACTDFPAIELPDEEREVPFTTELLDDDPVPGAFVNPEGEIEIPLSVPEPQPGPQARPSICGSTNTEMNDLPPRSAMDLAPWGLNIPFNEDGIDGPLERSAWISGAALDWYVLPWYFETNACNTGVIFRAHAGGATTGGSGYPRSELREMQPTGNRRASWDSDSGRHVMRIVQSINRLPEMKSHVVAGQIHDDDDDVTVVRLEGTKLWMTDGNDKMDPPITESYQAGAPFEIMFVVEDDETLLYYRQRPDLGTGDAPPEPFDLSEPTRTLQRRYVEAYFKAGSYVQSACDGDRKVDGEACSAYAEVEIFELEVSHE